MPERQPLERVYHTAALGPMAVARQQGGITWAEVWGDDTGILLWEDLESAAAWAIGQWGRPAVVVEIGRQDIRTGLLRAATDPDLRPWTSHRLWIYPEAIPFSTVRWHTYREDIAEPARVYELAISGTAAPPTDLPSGNITLPT